MYYKSVSAIAGGGKTAVLLNTFSKGLARCSGSNWVFFPDPNWLCAPGANIYMNDEGEILKFYYASPPDETFWQIESTNTAVEKITVDGCTADILISDDAAIGNTIVWMTADNAGFFISGFFTAEDLVRLAESVCEK